MFVNCSWNGQFDSTKINAHKKFTACLREGLIHEWKPTLLAPPQPPLLSVNNSQLCSTHSHRWYLLSTTSNFLCDTTHSYMTQQHSTELLLCKETFKKCRFKLIFKVSTTTWGAPHLTNSIINALLDANANRQLGKSPSKQTVNDWRFPKLTIC